MKTALLLATLVILLVLSTVFGYWVWVELGDVEMSWHGWFALSLGTILSLLVGGGLMALVFYSHRRGYDDRANRLDE